MSLKFYNSPFHTIRLGGTASKMALKVDMTILINFLIKQRGFTHARAAQFLGLHQSRISEIKNARIEKFTLDELFDILEKVGCSASMALNEQNVVITISL